MRDEISVPGLRRVPEFHAGFWAGPVASMMGVAGSGGSHGVRTSMRDSMRDPASSRFDRRATRGALKENRTLILFGKGDAASVSPFPALWSLSLAME